MCCAYLPTTYLNDTAGFFMKPYPDAMPDAMHMNRTDALLTLTNDEKIALLILAAVLISVSLIRIMYRR